MSKVSSTEGGHIKEPATELWYGVLNPHGKVSTVHAYRDFAAADRLKRADADLCRLVEVRVTVIRELTEKKGKSK